MQPWAMRGLRTALVTGGLLMLGTGIASADEDVDPDKPASPLDLQARVPFHIGNNAFGTPLGQQDLPEVDQDVTVDPGDMVDRAPVANRVVHAAESAAVRHWGAGSRVSEPVLDPAAAVTDEVDSAVSAKVADRTGPLTTGAEEVVAQSGLPRPPGLPDPRVPAVPDVRYAAAGNRFDGEMAVPVEVSGNAVAVGGSTEVENESQQYHHTDEFVVSNGRAGFLAGNAVDVDWAAPVQVTGNATAAMGRARTVSSTEQDVAVGTDVVTDGSDGALAGNVGAVQGATPVQVTGNSLAGVGRASAESEAVSNAAAGGWALTSGQDGAGAGNMTAVPVGTPVKVSGNGLAGLGTADAHSGSVAGASAGAERPGRYGVPTYLETSGDPALAAGNIAQPAVSGPAMLCGNAAAAVGGSGAECATASATDAGGTNRTSGAGSVASGSVLHPAVAMPVQGFGNAATGAGDAETGSANVVRSTAGGATYTRGHDSVLSGSAVTGGLNGPFDLFANSAAASGESDSAAYQVVGTAAGGHTGTTGDNSAAGGNMVTVPAGVPVGGFGNVLGAAGSADADAVEIREHAPGGAGNTADDDGLAASNLQSAPVAGAVQLFGNGAGVLADTDTAAATDSAVVAGGDNRATGVGGTGSGNVGQVPVTLPAQLFGSGASVFGVGEQDASSDTDLTAGGGNASAGAGGALSGNVVNAPAGSTAQAFSESVAVMGANKAVTAAETDTKAGGDTVTDGRKSIGSGNVVSPQALPVAQSFAAVASGVGGRNLGVADNDSELTSGGDIHTAGDDGLVSGNLVDVPAGAVVQPFGDDVAAIASRSQAVGENRSEASVGGTSTTSGTGEMISGMDATLPVGADVPIYDVPVEVLAKALTVAGNERVVEAGERRAQLYMPVSGGLAPTEVPSLLPLTGGQRPRDMTMPPGSPVSGTISTPIDDFAGSFAGSLDDRIEGVGERLFGRLLGAVPGLADQNPLEPVAAVVSGPQVLPYPLPQVSPRSNAPFAPRTGDLYDRDLYDDDLPTPIELAGKLPTVNGLRLGQLAELASRSNVVDEQPALGNPDAVTALLPAIPAMDAPTAVIPAVGGGNGRVDVPSLLPSLPAGELLPAGLVPARSAQSGVPAGVAELPVVGNVTGLVPSVPVGAGVPAGVPELPVGDLGGLVPGGSARSDVPAGVAELPVVGNVTGLVAGATRPGVLPELPVGDVGGSARPDVPTVVPELPLVGNVAGLVPGGSARSDVPTMVSELPVAEVAAAVVPALPVRADVPTGIAAPVGSVPARAEVPASLPEVPAVDDVPALVSELPLAEAAAVVVPEPIVQAEVPGGVVPADLVPATAARSDVPSLLPSVSGMDLPTAVIPAVPPTGDPASLLPVGGRTAASRVVPGLGDAGSLLSGLPLLGGDNGSLLSGLPLLGGDAGSLLSGLPAVGGTGRRSDLPNINEVTAVIPAVEDVTDVLPAVPDVPTGGLPGPGETTAVIPTDPAAELVASGGVVPVRDEASLTDTRAALANLFTVHPIS